MWLVNISLEQRKQLSVFSSKVDFWDLNQVKELEIGNVADIINESVTEEPAFACS